MITQDAEKPARNYRHLGLICVCSSSDVIIFKCEGQVAKESKWRTKPLVLPCYCILEVCGSHDNAKYFQAEKQPRCSTSLRYDEVLDA